MNNRNRINCLALTTLCILLSCVTVQALDPKQPTSDLLRTHFTADEGLPGNVVDQIAQTPDGFLWLITNASNLVRFDGRSFYQFEKIRAITLAVAPDGDLWVGTNQDLLHIPSSNFGQLRLPGATSYHPGPGDASHILCLRFGSSGVLWIGTAGGLFRYQGDQFVPIGPRVPVRKVEETPDGHVLFITDDGLTELAGSEIVPHPKLAEQLGVKNQEIFHVLKDRNGNTWYCTAMGVARETNGRIEKLGTYGKNKQGALRAYEDAQGTMWFAKEEGLFRVTSGGFELVRVKMEARSIFSDRDGNLWVGTNGDGLYRFKDRAVRMFTTDDKLPNNVIMTVIAAHDGTIWTGANCGGLSRFDGSRFQTFSEKDGLLNSCVYAIAEDANHDLWIGTFGGGAFRYHSGAFTQYSKTQGMRDDRVTSVVVARDGSVWFGTRGGVTHLKDGRLRNFTTGEGLSANPITKVFEDRAGGIWAGTRQGLDKLVGDHFENFAMVPRTLVIPLGEDREGGLFLNLDEESVALRLTYDRADRFTDLSAPVDLVETQSGDLWFGGDVISRVPPNRFAKSRERDEPLDFEPFSTADGLASAASSAGDHTLALTGDGQLWVATPKGLARFNLNHIPIGNAKPSIYLTGVMIGRNTQPASNEIVLPPGTSHVEVDFAAVELSSPEKIRMQYRLDSVDSEWLNAGSNPHAIYSSMPVGTHILHIRACNRNGIWDQQGMAFTITQQPYFYQTRWFIVAMVALGVLLVGFLYTLRVRQLSQRMSARFDERLAERTRVAREIHDTFLQTVQGSKMVADHALKEPADHDRMLRAMNQLSAWLGQATEEGRAALHSLRASTTEKNDLAEAFRRAVDECRNDGSMDISFSVKGKSRELHPVVRDEIYRIGYEAIRNACAHSGGKHVEVTLDYAHDLTVRVSDNGVGIDPDVAEKGKGGHFGLRGMRERAERIGSKLTLMSSRDSGTVITLVVPGRVAFHSAGPSRFDRIKALLN